VSCPSCGAETVQGRKFCAECGAPLGSACSSCGFTSRPSAKFCEECGVSLQSLGGAASPDPALAPAPSTPAPAAVSELRLVSVVFADLVGFTTLSESRDPEEVRELLSRYFEVCRGLVERYGGVVEKFIGDAVMAVWGTPVAQEDDAERAVRAALELVEAVQALGEEVGALGLAARAGVLTGTAAVSLGAQGQGMVAGDLVNTASRIQTKSEPGMVLVGEATKRATEAAVAYVEAGSHELKGKAQAVSLYRAVRVVAGRGGLLKSERLEAPFVGRDRELRLVKELFHASVEERRAHLVQVSGIAGIGKSRLSWEFFKYVDGLEAGVFWHRGRCPAYGQGMTYFALAEMVKGRAGILEGEQREPALGKLQAMVEEYVPDQGDRNFVTPRLAHLIGLEERSATHKQDLFAAWRLFLERLAEAGPVAMVFEDMQWADPSLLEFIAYLMEWSRSFPLYLLSLVRPDSQGAGLAATIRNATTIHLEPLPRAAMGRLLSGLVPGLPQPLVERILGRAEGVPLYAVETVRMLLDRGLLVEEGSSYRPVGEIATLDVPETLHALIAARLDGLGAQERHLIQDASVLGKTFTAQGLMALSALSEASLQPVLTSLVGKEVLSVQADPRSPELGQYGFLQDLVRTVAYETIPRKERRAKHLLVAEHLERAWGEGAEEIVEVVASHYLDAWRLDLEAPDSEAIKVRAREMLVRAGERAASLAAVEEAQSAFERAAELTESDPGRAALTERAGEMAVLRGRSEEAAARYEDATALFEAAGLPRAAARVQARLAGVEFDRDHLDLAIDRMGRARQRLLGGEPDSDLAVVSGQLGRFLALAGRGREATPLLEQALELAEQLELPEVYSQALNSRAIVLMHSDRVDEAGVLLRRALEVAEEHGLTEAAGRAYNNLAVVLEAQDRLAEVMALAERQLEAARRAGSRAWELAALTTSIGTLAALGRWDQAVAWAEEARAAEELVTQERSAAALVQLVPLHACRGELREAMALLDAQRELEISASWEQRFSFAITKAQVLLLECQPAEALSALNPVLAIRDELGLGLSSGHVKSALVTAAEAALSLGDLARAEDVLAATRSAHPGQLTPWLRAQVARLRARANDLKGDHATVEADFRASEDGFRRLGTVVDLAAVLTEHAEWLAAQGQLDLAEAPGREARQIWEQLRASLWLERLDRIPTARSQTA
jgi:class 3 adenylate cyclase/tetratricopeptide (TPR) repeat protein